MKTLMIIETAHGGTYFSITYLLAFLVAAGMATYAGFRKGYPRSTWLLITLTGVIFFIIGNKVLTYSPEQWTQLFTRFHFPIADKKTILGGILGLFAGAFIAKSWLRFNRPVIDTLAVALPLAMAISRIGCLFAGCCFGTPTNLPWGIRYDTASWAYHAHLAQGLVNLHDEASLAVHPVQFYQVIGCLLIAFLVWKSRKQWKSNGNQFLFSVICYGVLRIIVEFVRTPETNFFTGQFFCGLKVIQWLILGAILPGFIILILKESDAKPVLVVSRPNYVSDMRQVLLAILLSILVFTGRRWFDPLELFTIVFFYIPAIVALLFKLYLRYSVAGFRWVIPVVLVCSFSFMAQKSSPTGKENDQITFTNASLTGTIGSYYDKLGRISKQYFPGSCGSGYWNTSLNTVGTYQRTFYQAGIDVSKNLWRGKYYKYTIGARGFLGFESGGMIPDYPSGTTFGISPYVNFDWRWVGFGGGFTLGQMKLPLGHKDLESFNGGELISVDFRNFYIFPSLAVRFGPSDLVYVEAQAPALFPSSTPFFAFQAGIGSGLGKTNGTKVGIGYCKGIYAKAVYPATKAVVVSAFYGDNLQGGENGKRVFSFGVNYRFSYKTKPGDSIKHHPARMLPQQRGFSELHRTIIDIDGNVYHTLALGGQVWMAENLKSTRYRNGSKIPGVTSNVKGTGSLYNWNAVSDSSKLCPAGWRVPSLAEWKSFVYSLGGIVSAGYEMDKHFSPEGKVDQWWSSTELDADQSQSFYLNNNTIGVMFANSAKSSGLSVRCIRDN